MRKKDYFIILVMCVLIGVLAIVWSFVFSKQGQKAVISYNNQIIYSDVLTNECYIAVGNGEAITTDSIADARSMLKDADQGVTNIVVIKDGQVYVDSADCPDKVCVNMQPISEIGKAIVCMPNRIVVTVE